MGTAVRVWTVVLEAEAEGEAHVTLSLGVSVVRVRVREPGDWVRVGWAVGVPVTEGDGLWVPVVVGDGLRESARDAERLPLPLRVRGWDSVRVRDGEHDALPEALGDGEAEAEGEGVADESDAEPVRVGVGLAVGVEVREPHGVAVGDGGLRLRL